MIITSDILQIKKREREREQRKTKEIQNDFLYRNFDIENRNASLILYTKYYAFIGH